MFFRDGLDEDLYDLVSICVEFFMFLNLVCEIYVRGGSGSEDQSIEVSSVFVVESIGSVDQSINIVVLESSIDEGGILGDGSGGSFVGFDEFFFGVGVFGVLVGLVEERVEDGEFDVVSVDGVEGNG